MNIKKRPDIDEEKLGLNPFIKNYFIKVRSFEKSTQLVRQEDGINLPSGTYKEPILIEDEIYTKTYHDVDFREILMNCTGNAIKLFVYITYTIKRNQDYVWINNTIFQKESSTTKKKYLEAAHELVRYGIITPTIYPETYFINPLIFFCGDRIKKYPKNIKIRE